MDQFERRDLFNKAADLLLEQGWTTGTMVDATESHCLVGALRMVRYGTPYPSDDDCEMEEQMEGEAYAGIEANTLIHWNDKVAEDVEEVVQRLRDLAAGKDYAPAAWKH